MLHTEKRHMMSLGRAQGHPYHKIDKTLPAKQGEQPYLINSLIHFRHQDFIPEGKQHQTYVHTAHAKKHTYTRNSSNLQIEELISPCVFPLPGLGA